MTNHSSAQSDGDKLELSGGQGGAAAGCDQHLVPGLQELEGLALSPRPWTKTGDKESSQTECGVADVLTAR